MRAQDCDWQRRRLLVVDEPLQAVQRAEKLPYISTADLFGRGAVARRRLQHDRRCDAFKARRCTRATSTTIVDWRQVERASRCDSNSSDDDNDGDAAGSMSLSASFSSPSLFFLFVRCSAVVGSLPMLLRRRRRRQRRRRRRQQQQQRQRRRRWRRQRRRRRRRRAANVVEERGGSSDDGGRPTTTRAHTLAKRVFYSAACAPFQIPPQRATVDPSPLAAIAIVVAVAVAAAATVAIARAPLARPIVASSNRNVESATFFVVVDGER